MDMPLEALVARARDGDDRAVEALFDQLYPIVRDTVHRRLESDFRRRHPWMVPVFSTSDIVQETFLGVLRDLTDFQDEGEDSFLKWCVRQVRNRILDSLRFFEASRRDRRRQRRLPEGSSSHPRAAMTPSRASELRESVLLLYQAIRRLGSIDRRLVYGRLVREEPYAQLVARLRLGNEENARTRFRRAKVSLLLAMRRLRNDLPQETDRGARA